MYQTDWITEFRQKLAADDSASGLQEDEAEEGASPLIKRWLMLADQFLSTDNSEAEPA
jgi:hypothetical protein